MKIFPHLSTNIISYALTATSTALLSLPQRVVSQAMSNQTYVDYDSSADKESLFNNALAIFTIETVSIFMSVACCALCKYIKTRTSSERKLTATVLDIEKGNPSIIRTIVRHQRSSQRYAHRMSHIPQINVVTPEDVTKSYRASWHGDISDKRLSTLSQQMFDTEEAPAESTPR